MIEEFVNDMKTLTLEEFEQKHPDMALRRAVQEEFMKKYYHEHSICPKCKGKNYTSTLMGFTFRADKPDAYQDGNIVRCNCGWKGIVHELVMAEGG